MPRSIRFTYTRPGKETVTYVQRLVLDRDDLKMLVTTAYAGPSMTVDGETVLQSGSMLVWFVEPSALYDIGAFHDPSGRFTGWYTNLCTPFEFGNGQWSSRDLFLDLWQGADGREIWLDEDEFDDAAREGVLTADWAVAAGLERARIETQRTAGRWPPPIVRDLDLDLVLRRTGIR